MSLFGGGNINNNQPLPKNASAAYAASISYGYKICEKCKGEGYFKTFKSIYWLPLDKEPKPVIETFSCNLCYGHGTVRNK